MSGDHNMYATTSITPPKPIGYWILYPESTWGKTMFAVYHRPTDEQIENTKNLLGWGWQDDK